MGEDFWTEKLHNAITGHGTCQIRRCIKHGANLNAIFRHWTPLGRSIIANKRKKVVQILVAAGAHYNTPVNLDGVTPLILSIQLNRTVLAAYFVTIGANTCKPDLGGKTPLYHAICNQNLRLIKLLLDNGAKYTLPMGFLKAMEFRNIQIIDTLIDYGAPINLVYPNGWTPLSKAINAGNSDVVKFLLRYGADINMPDQSGDSPLLQSVKRENFSMVKHLVSRGVDINQVDKDGQCALALALKNFDFNTFYFLLENGADLSLADQEIKQMLTNENFVAYTKWQEQRISVGQVLAITMENSLVLTNN